MEKYTLLTFIFTLYFLTPVLGQDWEKFQSIEGNFQVETPIELTSKVDSIQTEVGLLAYHTYFYQADEKTAENLFYMVSFVDYPEGAIHSDSTDLLEDFFKTTIESATESVKGNLIYSANNPYYEYPGKIWRIEYLEDKVVIKTRAYLIKNRYYSIQTISFKELSLNPSSDTFLNSFQILN